MAEVEIHVKKVTNVFSDCPVKLQMPLILVHVDQIQFEYLFFVLIEKIDKVELSSLKSTYCWVYVYICQFWDVHARCEFDSQITKQINLVLKYAWSLFLLVYLLRDLFNLFNDLLGISFLLIYSCL